MNHIENSHRFIILIPYRNVHEFIIECLNSVFAQQYVNYEIYLLDDNSTDNTSQLIDDNLTHVTKLYNKVRLGPMENIYNALTTIPLLDEDIIVLLDGDDFLFGAFVFQILNATYKAETLLTYGQYIDTFGKIGHCSAYSRAEFENLRQAPWKASHLKTFKYKLFKYLLRIDPSGKNFKFDNGEFFMASSDMGIMIPLIELAGYNNIKFISNVVYCYRLHPNNDHVNVIGRSLQLDAEQYIRTNLPRIQELDMNYLH